MGKGINATHILDGQYTVTFELDRSAIDAEIAKLTAEIAALAAELAPIPGQITALDADIIAKKAEIPPVKADIRTKNSEIADIDDRLLEIPAEIAVLDAEIAAKQALMDPLVLLLAAIAFGITSYETQIAALEAEAADLETTLARLAEIAIELTSLNSDKDDLTAQQSDLSDDYGTLLNEKSDLEAEKTALELEQSTLPTDRQVLVDAKAGLQDQLDSLNNELSDLQLERAELQYNQKLLTIKKAALQKRLDYLQDPANVPADLTESVWCADLTEDLAGDVGVMEVGGSRDSGFNVQPGYEGNAVYDAVRDGKIAPALATPAAGVYFNWALRDGWQRWKPNYRYGTIAELYPETDTCDINLEEFDSTDVRYDANQDPAIAGVAIEYMSCNAGAFVVGDVVVVKFTDNDWNSPVVIGFKDNPKGCAINVTFTINGKTPTLPHGILIVDSTVDNPETGEEESPQTVSGASTTEEPGIVKDLSVAGFVYPLKIFLTDLVSYYIPDPNGNFYFYSRRVESPVGSGHYEGYIDKATYNPENPPNPANYDYYERATAVNRTLGATYEEPSSEMTAAFTVYTLQKSSSGSYLPCCSCSIAEAETSLTTSAIAYVSTVTPSGTGIHDDMTPEFCSGTEDIWQASWRLTGSTNASVTVSGSAFISSDEDGIGASFGGAGTVDDWWRYWTMMNWVNNTPENDPKNGTIICENEGSLGNTASYDWTMIPIQDKYI